MPRPAKPPRLYLNPKERVWLIRDGSITRRTGCSEADVSGAEKALAEYIGGKFRPVSREGDPARISVQEALAAYLSERAPNVSDPERIAYAVDRLSEWWASRTLAQVRGATCRDYSQARIKTGISVATIRRELGTLSAAINHWHAEHGPLATVPVVSMPPPPPPRERWLTRSEAARLLAGALGWYEERWCDIDSRKEHRRWRRSVFEINRHAARFILIGLYTGTRHSAILNCQWLANTTGGWMDLDRGVMHRRGEGVAQTKKRQPPVKLGRRILAHLRRWERIDARLNQRADSAAGKATGKYRHVVAYAGEPIQKLRRSWETARDLAAMDASVTPHILRHTRATWMMQAGVDLWEASGALGMSVKTLETVYGHHHPDWQSRAAEV
jgi:integrase